MNSSAEKISMASLDELLGCSEPEKDRIVELPLEQLHPFRNHPFLVEDDEKMMETVDSVKQYGVLMPGLVRKRREGGYEIVAGHRRKRASRLAGLATMPVIIKELSDAAATVIMVDSNIQRENLSCREKAFAYRMKYEALKEMGTKEPDLKRLDEQLAQKAGESRNTVQRYIRLTHLLPELLDMVDSGRLGFVAAGDISFLKPAEQQALYGLLQGGIGAPNGAQAVRLKEYSREGRLTATVMELLLTREAVQNRVAFKVQELKGYFPEGYGAGQMSEVIIELLERWKEGRFVGGEV